MTTNTKLVLDPFVYTSAEQMYDIAPTRPYDTNVDNLITQINNALISGKTLEDDQVWSTLVKLNPYRKTNQVRSSLPAWLTKFSTSARKKLQPGGEGAALKFKEANKLYRAGKFTEASLLYKTILRKSPNRLEVRNNLGLAQMHMGNDLLAHLEFEIGKKLDLKYIACGINATVVAERLGDRKYAAKTASETAALHPDSAQASFNALWYDLFEHQRYDSVFSSSKKSENNKSVGPSSTRDKFKRLYEISNEQLRRDPVKGIKEFGLFGRYGNNTQWHWIAGIVIFAIVALILVRVSGAFRKRYSFWVFILIGGFWYILFWGLDLLLQLPAIPIGYIFILGLFSRKWAKY